MEMSQTAAKLIRRARCAADFKQASRVTEDANATMERREITRDEALAVVEALKTMRARLTAFLLTPVHSA